MCHCAAEPDICEGPDICVGIMALAWESDTADMKRSFPRPSLDFWQKSKALRTLQENGLNSADLQICSFLLGAVGQTRDSRGTDDDLLSFPPKKEVTFGRRVATKRL